MRREKVITTADLFIMRLWKAQEECAVQACIVGMEVHVTVKADSFFQGCTEPKNCKCKKSLNTSMEIIGSPSEIQHVVWEIVPPRGLLKAPQFTSLEVSAALLRSHSSTAHFVPRSWNKACWSQASFTTTIETNNVVCPAELGPLVSNKVIMYFNEQRHLDAAH